PPVEGPPMSALLLATGRSHSPLFSHDNPGATANSPTPGADVALGRCGTAAGPHLPCVRVLSPGERIPVHRPVHTSSAVAVRGGSVWRRADHITPWREQFREPGGAIECEARRPARERDGGSLSVPESLAPEEFPCPIRNAESSWLGPPRSPPRPPP